MTELDVGYDVPARGGYDIADVQTPALIVDLDAFERNCARMQDAADRMGVRLRPHAKTHKSADIARYQIGIGATGICVQKVSEAEAFSRAGVEDILVANEVTAPQKVDRLARLAARTRILVCCDDASNALALSEAALRHDSTIEVLVEIDCGAGRCGVPPGMEAVSLATVIARLPGLRFTGLQAYIGSAQHIVDPEERKGAANEAIRFTRETVHALSEAGLPCAIVAGAGTGTFDIEGASGVYNELQCGSYIFMDADYGRVIGRNGGRLGDFEQSLFVLATVMSVSAGRAVCDAGLKSHSVDSGLPILSSHPGVHYTKATDEHGQLDDPHSVLSLNDHVRLVPGHIDPTCNLHDWYVGFRGRRVESLWPVTARGRAF